MTLFNINFRRVLRWFLPERINRPTLYAFVKSAIAPIRRMYGGLRYDRERVKYRLSHRQHVAHLEGVLNDRFDPANRRIKIDDSGLDYEPIEIFKANENKPVLLYNSTEDQPKFLWTEEETMFGGVDFVVLVPVGIPYDISEMTALINDYKTPGMGCIIQDV